MVHAHTVSGLNCHFSSANDWFIRFENTQTNVKKKTLKLRPIKFKQIDRIIWCNSIVGGGGGSMYIFDLFIDAVAVAIYEMFTFTVA